MFYICKWLSPVGELTMSSDGKALTGLWIKGQKYFCPTADMGIEEKLPIFEKVKNWLDLYFRGDAPSVEDLPLAPQGSNFRKLIWQMLLEIPYGQVTTYGRLAQLAAERMGRATMSSQAVGGAVGHNPISIIIPCHRVVGADGSLTGYAGGIAVKRKLLELEGLDMSMFYTPKRGSAL